MRVVQVLTQDAGGPVDHAADVASELARRGHDAHLVGPPSAALERAAGAGVTVHEAWMRAKTDLAGARRLSRTLRALAPDAVHLQDRRAGLLGRLSPGRARVVYTLHGVPDSLATHVAGNASVTPARRRDRLLYGHAERLLAQRAGGVVVVPSEAVAHYAREYVGLPSDQVAVVPNGVDTERFRPHPMSGSHGEGPVRLVWVGVLAPVKRVPLLLEVLDAVPGTVLTLVGDGPERAAIEHGVRRRGLGERVTLVGRVADPAPLLREADLFVLPSAAENLPLALLQAMASGLPVLASSVGGIGEVVRDGVEGRLVDATSTEDPTGADALARALRDLVLVRPGLPAIGAAGRARVEAAYSVGACVDRLLPLYEGSAS